MKNAATVPLQVECRKEENMIVIAGNFEKVMPAISKKEIMKMHFKKPRYNNYCDFQNEIMVMAFNAYLIISERCLAIIPHEQKEVGK